MQQLEKEFRRAGREQEFPLASDLKNSERRIDWTGRFRRVVNDNQNEPGMPADSRQDEFWDDNSEPP